MTNRVIVDAYNLRLITFVCTLDNSIDSVFFESNEQLDTVGSIYLGKVTNVVESISAYFINYGSDKNGFLPFTGATSTLKKDDMVVVQMMKNQKGDKGARLTGFIRLNGNYASLTPFRTPKDIGKISKQTYDHNNYQEVEKDLKNLRNKWTIIEEKIKKTHSPALIYKEELQVMQQIVKKYGEDLHFIVDGKEFFEELKSKAHILSPTIQISEYASILPIFHKYNLIKDIKNLCNNKIYLNSGASIVIDQSEAMVSIDVNSSASDYGSLEETAYRVNLEAVNEIVKQIKIRDLSGIIAIDFIDMQDINHIASVECAIKGLIKTQHSLIKMGKINEFGVLMFSRPRSGLNVYQHLFTNCECCNSNQHRKSLHNLINQIFYEIRLSVFLYRDQNIVVQCEPKIAEYILNQMRKHLSLLEVNNNRIAIKSNPNVLNSFTIHPQGYFKQSNDRLPKQATEKPSNQPILPKPKPSFKIFMQHDPCFGMEGYNACISRYGSILIQMPN